MCGNRVEQLESQIKELQASVEGLTDELVECKLRLRELEAAVDEDLGFHSKASDDPDKARSRGETRASGPAESKDGAEAQDGVEATKTAAPETEDDREESESDIIVA
jgi:hypothetical protein